MPNGEPLRTNLEENNLALDSNQKPNNNKGKKMEKIYIDGKKIKKIRAKCNKKQIDLAAEVGISQSAMCRIEKSNMATPYVALRIRDALNCRSKDILINEKDEKEFLYKRKHEIGDMCRRRHPKNLSIRIRELENSDKKIFKVLSEIVTNLGKQAECLDILLDKPTFFDSIRSIFKIGVKKSCQ